MLESSFAVGFAICTLCRGKMALEDMWRKGHITMPETRSKTPEPYTPPYRRNLPPKKPVFVPRYAPMVVPDRRDLPTMLDIYAAMIAT